MFREVPVVEVREVLRLWLHGHGLRATARVSTDGQQVEGMGDNEPFRTVNSICS